MTVDAPAALLDAVHAQVGGALRIVREASEIAVPAPPQRQPCALIVTTDDALTRLEPLLARLRDVWASELYVLCPPATPAAQLRALGLRPSPLNAQHDGWQVYHYQVRDYKRTPAWLNSRHWAHPERWDSERW